jgi:ectoine hydroxylase-related dioxygenase (phytanoyl-CoA dioxygenase family)
MDRPQPCAPLRAITEAERATYQRDGVVLLKNIYPPQWLAWLQVQLELLLIKPPNAELESTDLSLHDGAIGNLNQGSRNDMVAVAKHVSSLNPDAAIAVEGGTTSNISGRSIVETDAALRNPDLRYHHVHGPLPEIVAQLTDSRQLNFYSDSCFLKEPGSNVKTPFHQDLPYFLVDGGEVAVCWLSIDSVKRNNGAMGYVRGSHRWGMTFKPSDFVTEIGTFPEVDGVDLSGLATLPAISEQTHDLVYFDTEPGDVVVHHWGVVHGSGGNTSRRIPRRAVSVRYACEGCRYYPRPSSPVPFRKTICLRDGDPLEKSDRFPIVWPRTEEHP